MLSIRPEAAEDIAAIRDVESAAFGHEDTSGLVDALRDNGHLLLSLVAEDDGKVIGHIAFSPMTVETDTETNVAVCLGPLAVHPDHQRRGVGSALMEAGLAELRATVHAGVFLLGHPTYYRRFGFRPAREFDVHYQDDRDAFMAIELREGALDKVRGKAVFAPEFAPFE